MQQQDEFTCQYTGCGASFARQDNLSRHLESHLADRPYKCTLCLAAFSRKDTLIRHSSVHGEKAFELKEHLAKQSTRSSQACQACSKAKQRCQGSFPCERCQQKQISCCFNRSGKRSFANYAYDLNHSEQSTSSDSGPLETNEANIPPDPALFGAISETLPTSGVFSNIELPPADSLLSTAFGAAPEQGTNGFNHVVDPNFHYQWDPALDLTESPLFWTSHGDVFDNSSWSGTGLAPTTNVQRTGLSLNCGNVQSTQIYDVVHFPTLLPEDHDILLSENVRHVRRISYSAYEAIERFSRSQQEQQQSLLPPIQALHTFCDLYFEHIDPLFPFVHPSFIEKDEAYWILLLAVASIGATCSAISSEPSKKMYLNIPRIRHSIKSDQRSSDTKETLCSLYKQHCHPNEDVWIELGKRNREAGTPHWMLKLMFDSTVVYTSVMRIALEMHEPFHINVVSARELIEQPVYLSDYIGPWNIVWIFSYDVLGI
ncbi:unnamed protein product, partial [Aureobasidium pullulans]